MMNITQIKNTINNFKEIEFAYLFGSYANSTANQHSDIDIAVYIKKEYNNFDTILKIHHSLEITLKKEIDVISLNKIKNFELLKSIFDDGIVLIDSKDDSRDIFELNKTHEMQDYEVFKRFIDVA